MAAIIQMLNSTESKVGVKAMIACVSYYLDCNLEYQYCSRRFGYLYLTLAPLVYSQHLQLGLTKLLLATSHCLHSQYCR